MRWTKHIRSKNTEAFPDTEAEIKDFLGTESVRQGSDIAPMLLRPPSPIRTKARNNGDAEPGPGDLPETPPLCSHSTSLIAESTNIIALSRPEVCSIEQLKAMEVLREQLDDIFLPFVDTIKPWREICICQWLRAALWWALKGKMKLSTYDEPCLGERNDAILDPSTVASQAVLDIAKAWWICHQIIHRQSNRLVQEDSLLEGISDIALLEQFNLVLLFLRGMDERLLALSSSEAGFTDSAFPMDIDKSIWVAYFPNEVNGPDWPMKYHLKSLPRYDTLPPYAFGDTDSIFYYAAEFVSATFTSPEAASSAYSLPCVLSIVRKKSDWQFIGLIVSQTNLVHVEIQSDRRKGPTWQDVRWDVDRLLLLVKSADGNDLQIQFTRDTFMNIWKVASNIIKINDSLTVHSHETVLFERSSKFCHYINHSKPSNFPSSPVAECRVHLFGRKHWVTEGLLRHKVHDGLRLLIVTPPSSKTISEISHDVDNTSPVVYRAHDSGDGSPILFIRFKANGQTNSASICFYDSGTRSLMQSILQGMALAIDEYEIYGSSIESYIISILDDAETAAKQAPALELGASTVSVIDQEPDDKIQHFGRKIFSDHLRVLIADERCLITDRFNVGPGEVGIRLPVLDNKTLHIFRPPQRDLSAHMNQTFISKENFNACSAALEGIISNASLRAFKFSSQEDLHHFQEAVTGFQVQFDGLAANFSISRHKRLTMLPIRREATFTRIQLVRHQGRTQLLAFFHGFKLAKCMTFTVRATDEFEKVNQTVGMGVRIVDAKYSLSSGNDHLSEYICLHGQEFPTEHNDITVIFASETVRDLFAASLPSTVSEASRRFLRG